MYITQININGLDLISNTYLFSLVGLFDFQKTLFTNDLYGDGISFNRSKIKEKTLLLNGGILTDNSDDLFALNQILLPDGLKTITVSFLDISPLTFQAEISNRATGENSQIVSMQLTMPDPYLYSLPASLWLTPQNNAGFKPPVQIPFSMGGTYCENRNCNK